jgi:hypothetical protein
MRLVRQNSGQRRAPLNRPETDVADGFAAEALFQFSQDFGLGNLFDLVVSAAFAGDLTVSPRIQPLSHLSQTSVQFPPRPVAAGRRWLFCLRSLREKCTRRQAAAHHFRRKECEAQYSLYHSFI